ncbi:glycosyltransferase WbsX family protein [Parapedobacter tibetensis]|uniref:glycosyltransferase WbsX family protein n=1 Tax=Parapedobacter tibetensis TaxID=2972951 RepID=UPI00214D18D4|nr:glycoside hydrolase family 99-like domain-containing protein [Parapedobacter tibetensis]
MIRLIAYYLPQFHPIAENNLWHGMGFTEWTNVGKAKPLFRGHYQPRVPTDLGYYDLRLSSTRIQQAEMAARHGIEGFCYWHYWFGNGRRLLETPFNEVLKSGDPSFPFCLAWANETWRGIWHGVSKGKTLIEQVYPGTQDYIDHFNALLPAFQDSRYIKIDGKPIFTIYVPFDIPDCKIMFDIWNDLAVKNGLKGMYFIGHTTHKEKLPTLYSLGFDAVNLLRLYDIKEANAPSLFDKVLHKSHIKYHNIFPYSKAMQYFTGEEDSQERCYPTLIPNWDHSPRSGINGYILTDSTPTLFRKHIRQTFDAIKGKPADQQVVFIKSWNEWGEGNYLEPDLKFGRAYLEVLADEVSKYNSNP